jgi:hypothetical protein
MHTTASERIATLDSNDAVILEWQYTPANFFEEPVVVSCPDYEIRIEDGKATATVAPEAYDVEHRKREELHAVVDAQFSAVRIVAHRRYQLSASSMSRVYPDGRRDVTVFAPTAHVQLTAYPPDIRITDRAGNVVVDTKRERIDAERALAEAIGRLRPHDGSVALAAEASVPVSWAYEWLRCQS